MTSIIEAGKGFLGIETEAEKAAKRAGEVQAKCQEAGIAEQRRQFDITQQNFAPFQAAGADALEQQRILLGLGASPATDPNASRRTELETQIAKLQAGPQFATGDTQSFAGGKRGLMQRAAQNAVQNVQQGRLEELQSELSALAPPPTASTLSPQQQQQQAFDKFNDSPGQQFLRDRAQKNLLRNSAAIGGLGGGNVRSALVQQGIGFAQQDFQNQFARLGQLAGQGQAAVNSIGQFGANASGNIGNAMMAGGNARASGIMNQNQALQQGIQGVTTGLGLFSSAPVSPATAG